MVGRFLTVFSVILVSVAARAEPARLFDMNNAPPGGMYFATDIAGKVVMAPRLSMDVGMLVNGPVARVRVSQSFVNQSDAYVEGLYLFPLPTGAAVDMLEMHIGDRVVKGQVREKKQARKVYDQAKSAGQHASLMVQNRPNVFTNRVANIAPGEEIRVVMEYQQLLKPVAGDYELRFPSVLTPRYMPGRALDNMFPASTDQVPDGADLVQPGILDGKRENLVTLAVRLNPGFPLQVLESPSHQVSVTAYEDGSQQVLADNGRALADRDFILRWSAKPGQTPVISHFVEDTDKGQHHLVMITPPDIRALDQQKSVPREVTIILDKSGSMDGEPMRDAKSAVRRALSRLNREDRFNLIAFDFTATALWSAPVPADAAHIASAMDWLSDIEADGGTEMAEALELALGKPVVDDLDGRLKQVVFVTDGAVGNERHLVRQIEETLGDRRLFTIGIGAAPNRWFMNQAARAGRGLSIAIAPADDIDTAMADLFARIARPVLTDLQLHAGNMEDQNRLDLAPAVPGDVYAGDPLVFSWRTDRPLDSNISITGLRSGVVWQQDLPVATAVPATGIGRLWARQRLADIDWDIMTGTIDDDDRRELMLPLALDYGLLSDYTSFLAVEAKQTRPDTDPLFTRHVPAHLPAGMKLKKRSLQGGASMQDAMAISPRQTATPMKLYVIFAFASWLLWALTWWGSQRRIS